MPLFLVVPVAGRVGDLTNPILNSSEEAIRVHELQAGSREWTVARLKFAISGFRVRGFLQWKTEELYKWYSLASDLYTAIFQNLQNPIE